MGCVAWRVGGALLLGAAPIAAQARAPIETDRPDFTESSATVPKGRWQLETGYTVQRAQGTSHSLPESLLRAGVSSRVELRLSQNLSATGGALSFEDVTIGTKLSLGGQRGARPELALLLQSTLPTGGSRVTASTMLPSAVLLAGWELGGRWSLGGSAIAGREVDDHLELAGSAVVGYTLSDRWRSYAEVFTIQPVSGNGGERGESYLNGGVAHLVTPMVQLDLRIGAGIGGGSARYFGGVGLSLGW
jgi:hypothetical protein